MKYYFTFLLVIIGVQVNAQEFITLFDSSEEGVSCYRIPAITTSPNGDLIVAIDERVPSCNDLRGSKDINIVIRRSEDNGRTWSKKERIIDFPEGYSASDPSFIVDNITEEIFLFYNYMDLLNAPDMYRFQYVKSADNGKTWTTPVEITDQIAPLETQKDFQFITSGKGIQCKNGELLHTLVNIDKGLYIFGSEDHGQTWKRYPKAISPGDESKIIELSNGDWMVNSRVNKAGMRYVHTSSDRGESWISKADSSLVDPSCNAAIINLGQKGMFFSNANHPSKREGLTIRKSDNEGKTWNKGQVIYDKGAAYSDLALLKNGNLGLVFEKDDYKSIVFFTYAIE